MAGRTRSALYFADDKDVLDVLTLAKKKITPARLVELGKRRGLLLSSDDSRETLAERIAKLPFDWTELEHLLGFVDSASRAEKLSVHSFLATVAPADLKDAVEATKVARQDLRGEVFSISTVGNTTTVSVKYTELDPNRTRLVQRTEREFSMEILQTSEGFKVRHQAQERADDVRNEILNKLIELTKPPAPPEARPIELSSIRSPRHRTNFFVQLMKLPGFELEDVVVVNGAILDDDADNDDNDEAFDPGLTNHVRQVALRGGKLLDSKEYAELFKEETGRFISSVIWRANEQKGDRTRVEIEAGFGNAVNATDFAFSIRKAWVRNSSGDIKKTKVQNTERLVLEKRLAPILEKAADDAVANVLRDASADTEDVVEALAAASEGVSSSDGGSK